MPEPNGDTTSSAIDIRQDVEKATLVRRLVPVRADLEAEQLPADEPTSQREEEVRRAAGNSLVRMLSQLDVRQIGGVGAVPLVLIAFIQFAWFVDSTSVGILSPEIKNDLGTSFGFLIALLGSIQILNFVLAPLAGFLADRLRRVMMLSAGALTFFVSVILAGLSSTLGLFAGARALGGLGDLARGPVGFPLLTDWYPPKTRARVFAIVGVGGTLGVIVGPTLAGAVGSTFGWHATLVAFGGVGAAVALLLFRLKEPVRGRLDRLAMGAPEDVAATEQRPMGWTESWRAAWSVRTIRNLCYASPFLFAFLAGASTLTPIYYAQVFHLSPLGRGLIVSLSAVPILVGLAFSGPMADRLIAYRPGRVMSLLGGASLLNAATWLAFTWTPWLPLAIALNVIPAFLTALLQPALNTMASLVVPARIRGLGLQAVAPWIAPGILVEVVIGAVTNSNGVQWGMTILAPVLAIGALILIGAEGGVAQDIRAALAAGLADEAARRARSEGSAKLLVCRDVDVVYDGAQVLFGVDFDVREGELVALLGTNGAGKSTLLRTVAGIQQASNGAIFLDGDDITHLPAHDIAKRGVVMMPGGHAVFPTLTTEENLHLAALMNRREPADTKARLGAVLNRFPRLRDRWNVRAGSLSGGEQQMIGLAQALLMRPRLLMIDELSLGLSPQVVETLLDTLREVNHQGTTVIIVEQSINVALQIAERAVFMEKGEVRFDGPAAGLLQRPDVVRSVFLSGTPGLSSQRRPAMEREEDRETILEVSDLSLSYGGLTVLSHLNLSALRGEVVGVIGPNGAGKTSLFDAIAGFARPSSGEVRFLDRSVTKLSPDSRARLGLARSYQNVRLFPALTVRENVAVALERHEQAGTGMLASLKSPTTRRSERRLDNLVESLGLAGYEGKFLNELSMGTRRIVDIACLLATQPRLLLLDEPSSGLAQAETEHLGPMIRRIVKETGCGVLIIEHDLGLVASLSDRLVAMRLGAVMKEGQPATVLGDQEVIDTILGGASDKVVSRSITLPAVGSPR